MLSETGCIISGLATQPARVTHKHQSYALVMLYSLPVTICSEMRVWSNLASTHKTTFLSTTEAVNYFNNFSSQCLSTQKRALITTSLILDSSTEVLVIQQSI